MLRPFGRRQERVIVRQPWAQLRLLGHVGNESVLSETAPVVCAYRRGLTIPSEACQQHTELTLHMGDPAL
jgi:hypothetical protein